MRRKLMLLKQIEPETNRPWRLLEVFVSADGFRTRVCNGAWLTEGDARAAMKKLEMENA